MKAFRLVVFCLATGLALFAAFSSAYFYTLLAIPADEAQRRRTQYDCCAWLAIFCTAAAAAMAMLFFMARDRERKRGRGPRGFEVMPLKPPEKGVLDADSRTSS